ncbi:hypothetical protein D3C81_1628780 [compost metagenome]
MRLLVQHHGRRIGIGQDRTQRLVDFMHDGSGEFTDAAQARHMGEGGALAIRLFIGAQSLLALPLQAEYQEYDDSCHQCEGEDLHRIAFQQGWGVERAFAILWDALRAKSPASDLPVIQYAAGFLADLCIRPAMRIVQ